jgi:hypothetical protein
MIASQEPIMSIARQDARAGQFLRFHEEQNALCIAIRNGWEREALFALRETLKYARLLGLLADEN